MKPWLTLCLVAACAPDEALVEHDSESGRDALENDRPFRNPHGASATRSIEGFVALDGDFFVDYGTNGRHCGHCHMPDQGWSLSTAGIRELFERTDGLDPVFRTNDGANNPSADVSTVEARRAAYSMLLARGVFRVGIAMPATAEFELAAVDDPYGHASAAELSLFRRPLPAANLTFISQVMWDGRVTGATITDALQAQSNAATMGHSARPDPIDQDVRAAIVGFEAGLFNAQTKSHAVGRLDAAGARGGTAALAAQTFGAGRFDLFDAWATSNHKGRAAIFRGQELFNTKMRPDGRGACQGCHSVQNVGTNANGRLFDVGVSKRRHPQLPLYTLRRIATGEVVTTNDPGRALITGKWSDISRFKTPSLRGLAARAPYFHDGSAATLDAVVRTYEETLGFVFTDDERADLVAFLSAL